MRNKFLIVLIVLLILLVGGLGYYTFFILNKEEVISKIDLNDDEMATILDDFPYQMLIDNKNIELKDLTSEQITYIGYEGLIESQIILATTGECIPAQNEVFVKCIAKNLGLSDENINNMNTALWENALGGSIEYQMISPKLILSVIKNKLGLTNPFSESFSNNIGVLCVSRSFIYDKNINMFFAHEESGCSLDNLRYVVNTNSGYKENDIYKIYFTEGVFDSSKSLEGLEKSYDLYSKSNPTNIIKTAISGSTAMDEMKIIVGKNKSELDNYEITFKKVGDNYQFVSLNYIK